ncbi:hypothetical protein CSHISOI_06548 [Colletotrichum shisoi]|uniref:U1-type domain-containing protein n=1 Tax=Colletotrichum shisoi TaxID=2078593 RepID=A0A5Q4BRE6_9PEZI|nr:hypothetical protein CSHISOI_06548 [Colletotrichum shisoi]
MSEYWKSTPKYWCKHCSIFVRDTKLERQNHEATGKHQGALKRFLRDLHRVHEQEEREKERAKREVERLKGIAPGSSASAFSGPSYPRPGGSSGAPAPPSSAEAQRKQQMEQLAGLGVSIPTAFRGDMAMAGEWTVTATKVVDPDAPREKPVEAKAVGVRKREPTDEEKEEEEAVRGLFKKRKGWGSTRRMPEDDGDLDALLSSNTLLRAVKKEEEEEEAGGPAGADAQGDVKVEENLTEEEEVKKEDGAEDGAPADVKPDAPFVKREPEDDDDAGKGLDVPALGDAAVKKEDETMAEPAEAAAPAVVFKKRKPKNIRQK